MRSSTVTAILYLLIGAAVIYLFRERRKGLSRLSHNQLPELSNNDFADLIILLKTAYERMLYLGVLFIPLAYTTFRGADKISTIFFLLLIGILFLYNIGPRQKIMRLLERNGLSIQDLRQRGFRL